MTDSLAINALGKDSLAYNPYLYADSLAYANLNKYNTDSIPYSNPVIGTTSPNFEGLPTDSLNATLGNTTETTEGKSGINPWLVTGGVLVTAAGIACFVKGKGTTGFTNRMKAGWNAIKKDWFKIGEKAAEKAASNGSRTAQIEGLDSVVTIRRTGQNGGNTIVSVPGKERRISAKNAKALGITPEQLAWSDKAANLESTWVEFTLGGKKVKAFYQNGEFKKVFSDTLQPLEKTDAITKELDKIAKGLTDRKLPTDVTELALRNTRYNTVVDGSKIHYKGRQLVNQDPEIIKTSVTTNRYKHTEDPVQALAHDNAEFSKVLKNLKGVKPNYEGLTIGSAIYSPSSLKGAQIVIKNGEIAGVNVKNTAGIYEFHEFDSEKCKALLNKHESIFKNALNNQNKFEQVAYTLPT